jgi:hypothetical protein
MHASVDEFVSELRTFILSYAEHDPDCLGINAGSWDEQLKVCTCGFTSRLDELMQELKELLAQR